MKLAFSCLQDQWGALGGGGKVDVGAEKSVKENSPDMPSVLHKIQGGLHKPWVTLLRLPAVQEAVKIVAIAEGIMISGMIALPMEVVDVDEMVMLDRKPASDEGL